MSYLFGGLPTIVPGRDLLTGDRTYYVSTTGSDSSDGLTPGTAFATIAHANAVIGSLDLGIYNAFIQLEDGTYAGSFLGPFVGSGRVFLQGNASTPTNTVIQENPAYPGTMIAAQSPGNIVCVRNLAFDGSTLSTANAYIINGSLGSDTGILNIGDFSGSTTCVFMQNGGGQSAPLVSCFGNGLIQVVDNVNIDAGHYQSAVQAFGAGGCVSLAAAVTLVGTPTFDDAFAVGKTLGQIDARINGTPTFSGAATGARYDVNGNAAIDTGGLGANFFPGNAPGSSATGGQYI